MIPKGWQLPGTVKDSQSVDPHWNRIAQKLIDGVRQREVRPVLTDYGRLVELFRADWEEPQAKVAQVFVSVFAPGGLSAWHMHLRTTDRLSPVLGSFRVVLFDGRPESPTHGQIDEIRISEHRPGQIVVPPGVWHAVQNVNSRDSVLSNSVDHAYQYADPDHYRLPEVNEQIPYQFQKN